MDHVKAAYSGNLTELKKYLSKGVDINSTDNLGCTALISAAITNRINIVQHLLESKADTEVRENTKQQTALIIASRENHNGVVKLLVEKGAKVNAQDKDGYTALHWAAREGHQAVLTVLLQYKADTEIREYAQHLTALGLAALENRSGVVAPLLSEGALINTQCKDGRTPLWSAASQGHQKTVGALLRHQADVEGCCSDGCSPLHAAGQKGHTRVAAMLLDAGANTESKDNSGTTPLIIATVNKHREMVQLLCHRGALINASDTNGGTALHRAVEENALDIVKPLLKYQPELKKNIAQETALEVAKEKSYSDIVSVLKEYIKSQQSAAGNAASSRTFKRPQSGMKHYAMTLDSEMKGKKNLIIEQGFRAQYDSVIQNIEAQLKHLVDKMDKIEGQVETTADVIAELWKEIHGIIDAMNKLPETENTNKDLSNQHVYHIAKKIGGMWKQLGVCLGIDFAAIERINMENPNDVLYSTWALMGQWRDAQTGTVESKKRKLKEALKKIERMDLLEHI